MRHKILLGAALVCVGLAAPAPGAWTTEDTAANHVRKANQLLLGEHPPEAELRQGFLHLLDALLLVAPEARTEGAWPAKAAEARRLIDAGSIVDPRAVSLLGDCYRATHGGEAFRMPATVHTIPDAREHIRAQLATLPELLAAGANDEVAQRLLTAIVAIVTPMER